MFLSQLISNLEPDGSLVVDLADEGGPVLRFGPYESGMSWERREGERWVGTDHDYGVLLVHDAHDATTTSCRCRGTSRRYRSRSARH